jgi:hypothetical protein
VTGDGQVDVSGMKPILKVALKLKDIDLSKELALPAIVSGEVAVEGDPSGYGGRFSLENPSKGWQRVYLSGTSGNLDGIRHRFTGQPAQEGRPTTGSCLERAPFYRGHTPGKRSRSKPDHPGVAWTDQPGPGGSTSMVGGNSFGRKVEWPSS